MRAVIQVHYETLSVSVESFFQEQLRFPCHSGIEIPVIFLSLNHCVVHDERLCSRRCTVRSRRRHEGPEGE